MIELVTGDLFQSGAQALVNAVNCVGVSGKGIALAFRQRYPVAQQAYVWACQNRSMILGKVLVTPSGVHTPQYIIHFPTKQHWRDRSKMDSIIRGVASLADEITKLGLESIAIPALGCGNGGLSWEEVRPVIIEGLSLVDARVMLYEPRE